MQIKTTAKIKKMEVEKGSTGLKFKELKLTSNQVQQVNDLINGDEEVNITIEPSQAGLFDEQPEFELNNVGFERLTKIKEATPSADGKKKSKGKKKDGKKAASGEKDN